MKTKHALLLLLVLAVAASAFADEYRRVIAPVDGRGIPFAPPRDRTVCAQFAKVLNAKAKENIPLSCERPIPPHMKAFERPRWQTLDHFEHLDLLRKLDRYLIFDGAGVKGPKRAFDETYWRSLVERNSREGRIKLSLAEVDLNADGHPERVLKYENRFPCEPRRGKPESQPGGVTYLVIDEDLSVFQEIVILGSGADLFTYRGNAYFDWVADDGDVWVSDPMDPWAGEDTGCYMRFDPKSCPPDQRPRFTFTRACQYIFQFTNK